MKGSLSVERKILEEIRSLSVQQQKKILEVVRLLKTGIYPPSKYDITELKGCGKKLWEGINAQEYVDKIRKEWN